MASVQKYTDQQARQILAHSSRQFSNHSNAQIDPERTKYNYNLTPDHNGLNPVQFYNHRLSEIYKMNRSDVVTLFGWIITAPKELKNLEEQRAFFEGATAYLKEKYGNENIVSIDVHYDEGFAEEIKDRWGNIITDSNGRPKVQILGQPHLHANIIPVVADPKHSQGFKVCCKEVINRAALKTFHPELNRYLKDHNIKGEVMTGITKEQGRNYTVEELKEKHEMELELKRLQEIERKYNLEHRYTYSRR